MLLRAQQITIGAQTSFMQAIQSSIMLATLHAPVPVQAASQAHIHSREAAPTRRRHGLQEYATMQMLACKLSAIGGIWFINS